MSTLPFSLVEAIEAELSKAPLSQLQKAAEELSLRYRKRTPGQFMRTELDRMAYAAVRMPATYAAVHQVFTEFSERQPDVTINTLLDLGGGPGTVLWAAAGTMPALQQVTTLEQDSGLIDLGKRLASRASIQASWRQADITTCTTFEPHDMVVLSYVLGELSPGQQAHLVQQAWQAARKVVVVIEPGTMQGYNHMLDARQRLIEAQGYVVAPCPHALSCPWANTKDWCHFSARVERTKMHRFIKGADLGYEDEKYSYVIVSKTPGTGIDARILRHPGHHSGHADFVLCTKEGITHKTISRRDGDLYKKARKLQWGDTLSTAS